MTSPKFKIKTHLLSLSERSKFLSAPCLTPLSVIGDMTTLISFEQFTSNCVSGLVWASQGFCRSRHAANVTWQQKQQQAMTRDGQSTLSH